MIGIKSAPHDNAKEKIEEAMFIRQTHVPGKQPTYFILTYNEEEQFVHIHGANRAEELNLTLSYLPDEALLAVVNTRNPDNSDDGRDHDTIIDLVADPVVPSHLDYDLNRKEFVIGELESRIIAKRDAQLGPVPQAFQNAGAAEKPSEPTREQKPQRPQLRLVVDNE